MKVRLNVIFTRVYISWLAIGIKGGVISILVRGYHRVKIVGKIVHIVVEQNRTKNGTLWNSKTDICSI
jgi:hypothetical protein